MNGSRFQFLIGRLKTEEKKGGDIVTEEFQFLIGRLKTQISFFSNHFIYLVSIPYR